MFEPIGSRLAVSGFRCFFTFLIFIFLEKNNDDDLCGGKGMAKVRQGVGKGIKRR